MSFKELIKQDQRLVILRSLVDAGYDANESILDDCLALYGHKISRFSPQPPQLVRRARFGEN